MVNIYHNYSAYCNKCIDNPYQIRLILIRFNKIVSIQTRRMIGKIIRRFILCPQKAIHVSRQGSGMAS